jgi:hypothetical protein
MNFCRFEVGIDGDLDSLEVVVPSKPIEKASQIRKGH